MLIWYKSKLFQEQVWRYSKRNRKYGLFVKAKALSLHINLSNIHTCFCILPPNKAINERCWDVSQHCLASNACKLFTSFLKSLLCFYKSLGWPRPLLFSDLTSRCYEKIRTMGSVSFRGFLPSKFKCDKRKEHNEITFYPTIRTPICLNKKQKMLNPLKDPLLLCVTFTPRLFRSIPIQSGIDWNCVATIRVIWGYPWCLLHQPVSQPSV